jgi:hypothetical protein
VDNKQEIWRHVACADIDRENLPTQDFPLAYVLTSREPFRRRPVAKEVWYWLFIIVIAAVIALL